MARTDDSPEQSVARTRAWKADLRSTGVGESEYQDMCARAVEAAKQLAARRSA